MVGRHTIWRAVTLLCLAIAAASTARAQQAADSQQAFPQHEVSPPEQAPNVNPLIYICDSKFNLSTVDVKTGAVKIIGNTGQYFTDLAFAPKTKTLYGITITGLYKINPKNAYATFIKNLTGGPELNSLYIASNGKAFAEGGFSSALFTVDLDTGVETLIGPSSPYLSAGDLVYYNGAMLMSTTTAELVQINPKTGAASKALSIPVRKLFGLAAIGNHALYGFAGTSVYHLIPTSKSLRGRAKLLLDLSKKGVGNISGAAFDGYFGL